MHSLFQAKKEINAAEIPRCCVIQRTLTFFVAVICLLRMTVECLRYVGVFNPFHSSCFQP